MRQPTQFNNLTMADRAWLIYEFGKFLMSIEYYDYRISLYSLNRQFVELFQNIDSRQIERIQLASFTGLDKYLSRILMGNQEKITNTMECYTRKLKLPFQDVLNKITGNLNHQGFGILTSIDVQDTFMQKLHIGFRNYKILGACNPQFAYKAISLNSQMGGVLPCNVIVQEHENGEVEVSARNPVENIDPSFRTTQLVALANELGDKLRAAIDDLHRDVAEEHIEALPAGPSVSMTGPAYG